MAKCKAARPVSEQRRRHQETEPPAQRGEEVQLFARGCTHVDRISRKANYPHRLGRRGGTLNISPGDISLDTQDKLAELVIIAEFAAADESLRIGTEMRWDSCR